jgi:ATP-dependent DNA helicase RecQ
MNNLDIICATFKKIWGYEDFRYPQGEIVRTILSGKDSLIVMPTGGGKSICFQLPALLQTGLTLVISPLVALMENQVQELREKKLDAALLHSELPSDRKQQTLKAIELQKLRLLYLSPETLLSPQVWQLISQPKIQINALILDEAHCLVQWGDTFRPTYRRLGAIRSALLKDKPTGSKIAIAAFTATADPYSQKIITKTLQLNKPETFLISPYRHNLHLKVQTIWTPRGRKQQMLKFIQTKGKQSGLVYVRSRRESEELTQWFQSLQYSSVAYHAGLNAERRRKIETSWIEGKTQFVVCTCAFGMGINKSDVRWVVHFQAPQYISEYVQEVGRGGRDGLPIEALTLVSEPTGWFDPEDKRRRQFFSDRLQQQYQKAQQLAERIPDRGNLETIKKQFPDAEISLAILHGIDRLQWQTPFDYYRISSSNNSFDNSYKQQQNLEKQMVDYLMVDKCRWQFLLNTFGFTKEAYEFRCGHCDRCHKNRK